jgi:hypothetical protein
MDEATWSQEELTRAVRAVFRRSQTDPEFRALCLSNPNEALRLVAGKAVPPGLDIRFVDSAVDQAVEPGGSGT